MKNQNTTYTFDPEASRLYIFRDGKNIGGFMGPSAEKQFAKLLETDNEISITTMDKESLRKSLTRRLRALWIKQGVDKFRGDILAGYGVESTADLNIDQLKELIAKFSNETNKPGSEEIRRLRSNVLVILDRMGIYNPQDWTRVNEYMMNPRIAGKLLYQMNPDELRTLARKLRAIEEKEQAFQINLKRLSNLN